MASSTTPQPPPSPAVPWHDSSPAHSAVAYGPGGRHPPPPPVGALPPGIPPPSAAWPPSDPQAQLATHLSSPRSPTITSTWSSPGTHHPAAASPPPTQQQQLHHSHKPASPMSRDSSIESVPGWASSSDASGATSLTSFRSDALPKAADWASYAMTSPVMHLHHPAQPLQHQQHAQPHQSPGQINSWMNATQMSMFVDPHHGTPTFTPSPEMQYNPVMASYAQPMAIDTNLYAMNPPQAFGQQQNMGNGFHYDARMADTSPTAPMSACSTLGETSSETTGGYDHDMWPGDELGTIAQNTGLDRRGELWGLHLGDFDVVRTLGTGTFGKVLLVRVREGNAAGLEDGQHFAMKVLNKVEVVRLKQVEHMNSEKDLLAVVAGSPHVDHQSQDPSSSSSASQPSQFVVKLFCTFQDERNLYMLLEYVEGGELFTHLRRAGRFTADVARFYAANIVLALESLHAKNIVYRDLKPENILIDRAGYVKLTDFGFAKQIDDRTYTLCGTPEYLCPEVVTAAGHGKAADWWALGVLLFEMLCGYPPFFDESPIRIYEKILECNVLYPKHMDPMAKDLISRFLTVDRTKRLGNLKRGGRDVKRHEWFEGVDWNLLASLRIQAPIVPRITKPGDASYFERYADMRMEELPGVHRAILNRHGGHYYSPEVGSDPYAHLFSTF